MIIPRIVALEIFRGLSIKGSLPSGYVGNSYSSTLTEINGTQPFTWSLAGALPPSMSFSGSGTTATFSSSSITSSDVGVWSVVVNLRDATRSRVQKTFQINIISLPLQITNSFSNYTAGVVQSFDYTTSGGASGAKTFSVTSGSLPPGLSLSSAGHISGNTTGLSVGTHSYSFGVTATDLASSTSPELPQSITVTVVAISITNSAPAGTQGTAYSFTYTKSGGTGAVTWSKQSGTLPAGLSLSSSGVLSGTPSAAGTYTWVVAVTDNAGTVATHNESATIAYPTLTLTGTYPAADALAAYIGDLAIAGGSGSYSNARATVGSLPSGFSLSIVNVSGAYKLRLSGTGSTDSSYSFTVAVDSSDGQTATSPQTFVVNFSPAQMFASSEQGIWLDASDFSTMFQNAAGTTPVTATGQSVLCWKDKSGNANHMTQSTSGNAPVLQQDGSGYYYLQFTSANSQYLQLASTNNLYLFSSISSNKTFIMAAGVKFDTLGINPTVFGRGLSAGVAGRYWLNKTPSNVMQLDCGDAGGQGGATGSSTNTSVQVISGSITDTGISTTHVLHVNGAAFATGSYNQSSSAAYRFMVGAFEGSTAGTVASGSYMNGRVYGLILRFASTVNTTYLAKMETWIDGKCGAY